MTDLKRLIAQLSPEELERLEQSLSRQAGKKSAEPNDRRPEEAANQAGDRKNQPVEMARREPTIWPLSLHQERFWVFDQLAPGVAAYRVEAGLRLSGRLDVAALRAALGTVIERHEPLRTVFVDTAEGPRQRVEPRLEPDFHRLDTTALRRPEERISLWVRELARLPFQLGEGPLVRAVLVRLAEREHVLLLALHHIISDAWSMGVLVREWMAAYRAATSPSALDPRTLFGPPPPSYGAFATWQRDRVDLDRELSWWRRELDDYQPLELPLDRPRPQTPTFRGRKERILLPRADLQALRRLARRGESTLFHVLSGALFLLLSRLGGRRDVAFGTAIADRPKAEHHGMIGCFINTLVLRQQVEPKLSFERFLRRCRDRILNATSRGDLPFERLAADLGTGEGLRQPLVPILFILQNAEVPRLDLPGLRLEGFDLDSESATFDLVLSLGESERGLEGFLLYSTDLFHRATARRWVNTWLRLLRFLIEDVERPCEAWPFLSEAETQQLRFELTPFPSTSPPTSLSKDSPRQPPERAFLDIAGQRSDAVAVVWQGEALSFGELDRRSARLASWLQADGLGWDSIVALALERSPRLAIGFLACLRAEIAFLPIDPWLPPERFDFMVEDARASLVLRDANWPDLTADTPSTAASRAGEPLAYVVYTSGSTGRPKGVAVSRRSLSGLLQHRAPGGFGKDDDRVLPLAGTGFDATIWHVLGTLSSGSTLVLPPHQPPLGAELAEMIDRQRITRIATTPSTLAVLPASGLPSLRSVSVGGEACTAELVARWAGRRKFMNSYGPTEATVLTSQKLCRPGEGKPTIGRAMPQLRTHAVDARLRLVSLGQAGELVIGGTALARGYLGRPSLTARVFVPDPFALEPGARLYRTGDLARILPSGDIDYLGRFDQQVKLRGFRVELGEIEACLATIPTVLQAAVQVVRSGERERLIAFLETATGEPPSDKAFRDGVASLPEFMRPTEFVALEALPRTRTGKLDRRALPIPDERSTGPSTPPRNPREHLLADIWREILGLETVGIDDSFFALGGHSLLATQIASRLAQVHGIEVPLAALFERSTIRAQASYLETLETASEGPRLPPLRAFSTSGDAPLSFAQERLYFLHRLQPESAFYNMFGAHRLRGPLVPAALDGSLVTMTRRHEALRTLFPEVDGKPVQRVVDAPESLLRTVDLSALRSADQEQQVETLAIGFGRRPFRLASEPLLRAALLRLDAEEHVLFLNLHHIVADGWSMGVLLGESMTLYRAASTGIAPELVSLPIQMPDFAHWQRDPDVAALHARQLDYWRRQLDGLDDDPHLPFDRPRPKWESFRGALERFALEERATAKLRSLAKERGLTPAMVSLAAFQALLARHTGQQDLGVGLAIAQRNRRETESLIGFFVNTLVIRARMRPAISFSDWLDEIRRLSLEAYAHQDLPFERLVEELRPERRLSHNPLVQVMFGYQNMPLPDWNVDALAIEPLSGEAIDTGSAKFDLTLFLFDRGQESLDAAFELNLDLFDRTTIRRLGAHLRQLLRAGLAAPETPLAELPLWSEAEAHQILVEWRQGEDGSSGEGDLVAAFVDRLKRAPDAILVVDEERQLSVGGLWWQAAGLARRLRPLDAEARIGLYLEPSAELLIAALGVLVAGGAYVPLGIDHPPRRLQAIVEDAELETVIQTGTQPSPIPEIRHLTLDLSPPAERASVRTDAASGTKLACVIFTSGSTGRPKGVQIPQQGISRMVLGADSVRLRAGDRLTLAANPAFDASTFEIWAALLTDATAVIVPRATLLDSAAFHRTRQRHRLDHVFLTTALLHQHIAAPVEEGHPLDGLEQLFFGGEAVDAPLVRRLLDERPPRRLLHFYGPAEGTTFATWFPVKTVEVGAATVPIGRPVARTWIVVVDRQGQPVPVGVAGEVWLGGAGLARGYARNPAATAEAFRPDPFTRLPGERLYLTGDRVRRRADGALEFLGRVDDQIKIRGFRVELGEIEAALRDDPAVVDAAVLALPAPSGGRRLIAYTVLEETVLEERQTEDAVMDPDARPVTTERVDQWRMIFDDLYGDEAAMEAMDAGFNRIGWRNTYTGEMLSEAEMRHWLDDTIARIASLKPRRLLEIGCGTGMILFRVAPGCEAYQGRDVSPQVIGRLETEVRAKGLDQVELRVRSAEALDDLAPHSFDTVVLNSVVQYFPSAEYLETVLAGLVEVVEDGGAIFLGDLRSLPLIELFHVSLTLHQAAADDPPEALEERWRQSLADETELFVAPSFFAALAERLPRLGGIEIHPKQGTAHNELTGFRYQVVLRVGTPQPRREPQQLWRWGREVASFDDLVARLEAEEPTTIAVRDLPNARLTEILRQKAEFLDGEGTETVGVDPMALWGLAQNLPYEVELGWAHPGSEGRFEAIFRHRALVDETPLAAYLTPTEATAPPAWPEHTNRPAVRQPTSPLVGLRQRLAERLPAYMLPGDVVTLDALPLTANGKVDRRALADLDITPTHERESRAPRTLTEERLRDLWREVLGREDVAVDDHFFEVGGHSLLATQTISRIRQVFGIDLPLRSLFENPTLEALALRIDQQGTQADESLAEGPVAVRPRPSKIPLSYAQERLWFLSRLDRDHAAPSYNETAALRLDGELDRLAFRRALDRIVRRHEVLRTQFPEIDGKPEQRIDAVARFPLLEADLSVLAEEEREHQARKLARQLFARPYDLAAGPLVRGLLIRLAAKQSLVIFAFHHVVFDGWSVGIWSAEWSAEYAACRADRPSPLPPLSLQYADFAIWQRRWLDEAVMNAHLEARCRQLEDLPALDWPTDRPRPRRMTSTSNALTLHLPASLAARLRTLAAEEDVTLFMLLLGSLNVLLGRQSGQLRFAVGTPIANRNQIAIEPLIGFFVNMLVLPTDLAGNPRFLDLLARTREACVTAYAHQDLPFEKLVEELEPERRLDRSPLFQIAFQVLQPPPDLALPGLQPNPFVVDPPAAKFDLNLPLIDTGKELMARFEYNADLFDSTTIERLARHWHRLLEAVVETPAACLADLAWLSPAEKHQVVGEWNDQPEQTRSVVAGLMAQAAEHPSRVALVSPEGQEHLTYRRLLRRVDELARGLRAMGVQPGEIVATRLERSPAVPLTLFALWRAGAVYLPLDPSYPSERLRFMLEDADVRFGIADEAEADGPRRWLSPEELIEGASDELPAPPRAEQLAYLIYTSGSSGRPKGVALPHATLDALVADEPILPRARTLQFSALGFDVSLQEITTTLVWGGTLVLVDETIRRDPARLLECLEREQIERLYLPYVALEQLATLAIRRPPALRAVISAGEQLRVSEAVARFFAEKGAELHNHYGPSETHVVTAESLTGDASNWPGSPAIGRPVAQARCLVVDRRLQPVPIGVRGELLIGGPGLAHGYRRRSSLTGARFLPDFTHASPGARLYKSGDLVRALPDGRLIFLGRIDQQIKIRGFRVELGEIENALRALSSVREAAVGAPESTVGRRLVAYVVAHDPAQPPDAASLRDELAKTLPEAMIPTVFTFLDALPTLPSGKLDRRHLPAPAVEDRQPSRPKTPLETLVAEVWAEVLDIEPPEADDHFFHLGGHSLLATQVIARLRDRLGHELPLAELFEAPTVAGMAARLDRLRITAEQNRAASSGGPGRKPENPVEEALAEIFESVLGVAVRGVEESFFDLGGQSLLATLVIAGIYDRFELDLPVRTVFEAPTIEALARRILDADAETDLDALLGDLDDLSLEEVEALLGSE